MSKGKLKTDRDRLLEISQELGDLREEVVAILEKHLGEGQGVGHVIGEWMCSTSPVGLCVYNVCNDPALRSCIFCHMPYERN